MNSDVLDESVATWRDLPAAQQPEWPDPAALADVTARLATAPGLVSPAECDDLRHRLAEAAEGRAIVLQGGDCAEMFGAAGDHASIRAKLKTLLQMAVVFTYASAKPVVKIGRWAGQYAKPRSSTTETVGDVALPAYRGDAVNGAAFDAAVRVPDPERLWRAYEASRATLDAVRTYAHNGYAGLDQLHRWNRDFVADSPAGAQYEELAHRIDHAVAFMRACGVSTEELRETEVFAGHEGLLLDYEDALTRLDPATGRTYATSGHLLWIGERTRALDGAHIEYFSTIANPVGLKLGPTATPDEVRAYVEVLDPERRPGRLTFITRMGARQVRDRLPALAEAARSVGSKAAWICDPMHGNTFVAPSGHKTRLFSDILDEVKGFFQVLRATGLHPGGVHVELTGEDVTECVGGGASVLLDDLHSRYETGCDPRLNRSQSLDLAFQVGELL
ncbi:class II 3-deoxy-7-phosphoheptulonate synthase [Saccharothrix sp. Mg75]|uniref:class II 3-deoxy-7-phosphoheptulonate synthase n=1 Tax=Saccharothrix sp. Mg75 TaxID=3445357 RepID=UPI003EED114C